MAMNLSDFDDPIANERSNNSALYINKYIARSLINFAESTDKDPQVLAEYFLQLGINSAKHYENQEVIFDIKNI
jgi:hypothetical protein